MGKIMNIQPVVSICCITYNHEKYIRDCIEGFLMQKTTFPIEIIIHDDASTDGTTQIIKEYAEKNTDLFVIILQTENQYSKGGGSIYARFVFPRARGKYIALCEGDDYWTDPLKLQKQVDILEQNSDYSLVFHNAILKNVYSGKEELFNKRKMSKSFKLKDVILKSWFTPTASFVFRKENVQTEFYNNVNGDMQIVLNSVLKGKLYYIDSIMSVYNYGTTYSASRSSSRKALYKKALNFLTLIDNKTKYKYLFFTSLKRIKITVGMFLNYLK